MVILSYQDLKVVICANILSLYSYDIFNVM